MRHYLVVANQTLGGAHLLEAVQERVRAGDCAFHVVVPASHPHGTAVWTEGEAKSHAGDQLEAAMRRFREVGAQVTGEVGDASPVAAANDALLEGEFDEIIVSTLPLGVSRWLRQDVVHRIQRAHSMPVIHIEAVHEPA